MVVSGTRLVSDLRALSKPTTLTCSGVLMPASSCRRRPLSPGGSHLVVRCTRGRFPLMFSIRRCLRLTNVVLRLGAPKFPKICYVI